MEALDVGKNTIYDYASNQAAKTKAFRLENSLPLHQEAQKYSAFNNASNGTNVGCTASYPMGSLVEDGNEIIDKGYSDYMQSSRGSLHGIRSQNSSNFLNTNSKTTNNNIPSNSVTGFHKQENFANSEINPEIPTNDPTSEMLLDMKSRPMTDFTHNNMVPYYGSSVKQNMAGTGVSSGNYTLGKDVNAGFDDASPFLDKLNRYTGLDENYLHKREVGPQFSPAEQQTGWVHGSPDFRPDTDRYTQSLFVRNDLRPCEAEQVGPGLDLDPSIPAQGGFQQFTRVMPNNVNDYKANQLENRVINQQFQLGGQEPTSLPGIGGSLNGAMGGSGVAKNRPNRFWDQTRYPTMTTKVSNSIVGDEIRPDYELSKRPNNAAREQINYGFGTVVLKNTVPTEQSVKQTLGFNVGTGKPVEAFVGW